jgi:hypothetical protein
MGPDRHLRLFIVLTLCAVIVAHAAHLRIPLLGR